MHRRREDHGRANQLLLSGGIVTDTGRHSSTSTSRLGRSLVHVRAPWWRRLEARVVSALVLLGVISVGASAYLVSLTVRYFDDLGDAQVQVAEDVIDQARPFYEALV